MIWVMFRGLPFAGRSENFRASRLEILAAKQFVYRTLKVLQKVLVNGVGPPMGDIIPVLT